MKRLTHAQLIELGEALPASERGLLVTLDRLGLLSHAQAAASLSRNQSSEGTAASQARVIRAHLQRLTDLGLLARLDRRIGGLRAGSAGYCYYVGPAGQRLVALWQGDGLTRGRFRPEPGSRYVRHRLAVSQLYVDLLSAADSGELDLLAFDSEPACWREYADVYAGQHILKPDAFARMRLPGSSWKFGDDRAGLTVTP